MEKQVYQACKDGKVEEVRKLLQNSQININWQNQNDYLQTPFYIACKNGHIEIVKLLLNDERVDINKVRDDGKTPFYVSCENGRTEVVKLLLSDNRVDLNKAENTGWTPFYRACGKGHIEIVKLLLNDQRVDINKAANGGSTPFLIACYRGKTEVVKYLLESGKEIDINKKNNEGISGLDYAKQNGNTDIVKLIESFQMKIEVEKKNNEVQNEKEEQKRKEAEKNLEEQRKKIEDEKRKLEEEKKKLEDKEREKKETERKLEEEKRKKEGSKKVTYDIEYNTKSYLLKTTAQTIADLENDIKSKLKLQGNTEFDLEFFRKGKYFILDDMEDLEDGMTIKVSISTQLQSQSDSNLSSLVSNLTVSDLINVNNECWWNTKPNEKINWEEKGYVETKYIRYLLRNNKQNVVDNENEYLKKLELLMTFFGGVMKRINKAYVLFNEKLFDSFQHHRASLFNQQRASPTIFKKDDWQNGNDVAQKFKFHNHYSKIAESFDWNHSKFLHAIPMIHGTSETALYEICQTGLAATGATDAGFYGQGMYFSSSLFYSSRYAKDSPDGKPFIICMITPGNVYPVTESPFIEGPITQENPEGFIRRPCKLGYQSHYTLVDKRKFNDAYPITGNIDGNVANELVVFEKAQVLPLFAIYYK